MIKFGTGGWRGNIGKDFIYDNVLKVSQGLADRVIGDGLQGTLPSG